MALRRKARSMGVDTFPGFADVSEIGSGSLATVFRAREVDTNRLVALKLLNVRDASPRALESFQRESLALGALSAHPNIVTLFRTFPVPDGRPVLVLELCRFAVSERLLGGAHLPVAEAVSIAIKVAGALETAHRAGILHRDVKPQNILVTEFGEPALADFGVAMLQSSTQTTAGLFDFTTLHAAPELLEGTATSAATDVYELASTLYQLIAGESAFRSFDGESPASVILRILRDPVAPVVAEGVPVVLSDLLIWAMSKDKDHRPPTAAEFAAELSQIEIAQGWPQTQFLIRGPEVSTGRWTPPDITRVPVLARSVVATPPPVPPPPAPVAPPPVERRAPEPVSMAAPPAAPAPRPPVPPVWGPATVTSPPAPPVLPPRAAPAPQPPPVRPPPVQPRVVAPPPVQPPPVQPRVVAPPDPLPPAMPPAPAPVPAPAPATPPAPLVTPQVPRHAVSFPPDVQLWMPVAPGPARAGSALPAAPEPDAGPDASGAPPPHHVPPAQWGAPAPPAPVAATWGPDPAGAGTPPAGPFPIPPTAAMPARQPFEGDFPVSALRAPMPNRSGPPQFVGDLSLDPLSLRRRLTLRSGWSALSVDEHQLTHRVGLRRTRFKWSDVHGFEARLESGGPGRGHLAILTSTGPVELSATQRAGAELRFIHALLDAYRIRSQLIANR